jgi:hypothetical protein
LCLALISTGIALYLSLGREPLWIHVLARTPPAATALLITTGTVISWIAEPKETVEEPFSIRFTIGNYMVYVGPVEHGPENRRSYRQRRSPRSAPWSVGLPNVWNVPVLPSVPESSTHSEPSIHLSDIATLPTSPSLRRDVRRTGYGGHSSSESEASTDRYQSSESDGLQPWDTFQASDSLRALDFFSTTRSAAASHVDSGRVG